MPRSDVFHNSKPKTVFNSFYYISTGVLCSSHRDVCDARKEIYLYKEFLSVSVWVRGFVEMVKVRD